MCRDTNISEGLEPCVETEYHFVYVCSKYNNLRNSWLEDLVKPENFENLDQGSKLGIALNLPENVKPTAKFIISAYFLFADPSLRTFKEILRQYNFNKIYFIKVQRILQNSIILRPEMENPAQRLQNLQMKY